MVMKVHEACSQQQTFRCGSRVEFFVLCTFWGVYVSMGLFLLTVIGLDFSRLLEFGDWNSSVLVKAVLVILYLVFCLALVALQMMRAVSSVCIARHHDGSYNLVFHGLLRQRRIPLTSIHEIHVGIAGSGEDQNSCLVFRLQRGKIIVSPFADHQEFLAAVAAARPAIAITSLPASLPSHSKS